ncbi:uncharacterized protein LOC135488064 [Lineus longissimus]|uniref:uncharacterized protein LOC135488064 n=1 Tax=Lineus longissimus TaxID=88925 RepID=UPI00315D95BF
MPLSKINVDPLFQTGPEDLRRKKEDQRHAEYYTDTTTYIAMLPLLNAMKLFGLYHGRHSRNGSACALVYSAVISFLLMTASLRMLLLFESNESFSPELFTKVAVTNWFILCMIQALSSFRVWYSKDKAPGFMTDYHKLVAHCEIKHDCFARKLRKRAVIATSLAVSIVVINTFLIAYLLATSRAMDFVLSPLQMFKGYPSWVRSLLTGLATVNLTYTSAAWVLPLAFGHCISYVVRSELNCFNNAFSNQIDRNGAFDGDLSDYRSRHQAITRLVKEADDLLGVQISCSLICGLALEIFMLYNTLWDGSIRHDSMQLLSYIYWIAGSGLCLVIIIYDGAMVNSAAHQSLSRLHDIKLQKHSNIRDLTEITIFLNKLSGPPIGLTAIGLFVIDKPTILTAIGMFLTYFVIVVQFRMPTSTGDDASANATLT